MIQDREEFEDAVERARDLLAHAPKPGSEAYNSFMCVLDYIESRLPEATVAQRRELAGKLTTLDRELADFYRRHPDLLPPEQRPHAFSSGFAFGRDLRGH
jgi:hypothetical protein